MIIWETFPVQHALSSFPPVLIKSLSQVSPRLPVSVLSSLCIPYVYSSLNCLYLCVCVCVCACGVKVASLTMIFFLLIVLA